MRIFFAAMLLAVPLAVCGEPSITVNATGSVKATPTALQIWVTIKDKGPDAGAAVEALKATREKLAAKLAPLGVKADQIKSDLPVLLDKAAQEAQRIRRTGGRLKRKPAAEEKPEVEMQQTVRALIPLTGKDADAILVEAENLKAKVKAAKLIDEKAEGTEGEEDDNMGRYNDGQRQQAVVFSFFAPHSEELQNQAMSDALKKANDSAARAAKAMGKANVELYSLVVGSDGSESALQYQMRYNYDGYERSNETPRVDEGFVSQTPQILVQAQIQAIFRIK